MQGLPLQITGFLNWLQNVRSASPHTLRAYQSDLLGAFELSALTIIRRPEDGNFILKGQVPLLTPNETELLGLARAAQSKWGKLQSSSRNRKTAVLKSFFGWLYAETMIDKDLSLQLGSPKVPLKMPHFLAVDEVVSLLKSARENANDYALLLLLYGGGLRVSEACNLKWEQINLKTGTMLFRGKGLKERVLAIPPPAVKALKELDQDGEFIFGKAPLSTRKAYSIVRDCGRRAGLLKPLHPHALRHSYATHMLSSGADLRTLQELLGHSSLAATQKYLHLSIDQMAQTMEAHHPLAKVVLRKP
jgi:site-specific recombinase XerD